MIKCSQYKQVLRDTIIESLSKPKNLHVLMLHVREKLTNSDKFRYYFKHEDFMQLLNELLKDNKIKASVLGTPDNYVVVFSL